jgi:hypothetical protein
LYKNNQQETANTNQSQTAGFQWPSSPFKMGIEIHPVIRMVFYFAWFFLICLVANLLFILTSILIMPFDELRAYIINSHIAFFLWNRMQYVFEYRHGASITFSGDVIPSNENAIVVGQYSIKFILKPSHPLRLL